MVLYSSVDGQSGNDESLVRMWCRIKDATSKVLKVTRSSVQRRSGWKRTAGVNMKKNAGSIPQSRHQDTCTHESGPVKGLAGEGKCLYSM